MAERPSSSRRGDARERTRKELLRFQRRQSGGWSWRALALIGSVGWPIVLLATGGALLGRYLDVRFGTGVHLTLLLLTLGTLAGSLMAYRTVRETRT
ncbi:AtpZ/AtpI family protein [Corallococcus sp. AS-1-6]|uniref:AtpZ/AtpI family protein n=1 Tax=Corallococcus TaxID=83461 RepID=UPI001CBE692F|nr:AtpZ/AtpI family protein [Corallococcus sp. AS-1-6]MBZ4370267.1 AtpZ/AtpI family protein [Corallococcus sp. AS-1-6]